MAEAPALRYAVVMDKKTTKSPDCYFVVVHIRRDEFENPACFHGVGYWADSYPTPDVDISKENIIEVWIPWKRVDHVASLMYRQKN
jgi:hypothetical protein